MVDENVCKWYNGPSLMKILDELELPKRDPTGPIKVPILYKMNDKGIVVFGKIERGTVTMGEKLVLMPSNLPCQVLNIYNSKCEAVRYAKSGENVQLRLSNIEDENMINKGDVLCKRKTPMPISELFEAEIEILELINYKPILSKGYQCILHIHTFVDECVIKDIMVAWEPN
jgi:peptide chain release factor subunit 3